MPKRPARITHALGGALDDVPGPLRAVLAAAEGAFFSLIAVALPIFVVWLASPNVDATGWRAVQLGLAGWCLVHLGAVDVPFGTISLAPLLGTLLALGTAARSASTLAAGLARRPGRRLAWAGDLRRDVAVEGALFVGTYLALGLVAALTAQSTAFAVSVPRAVVGFVAVSLAAYLWGLRAEFRADLAEVAPGLAVARDWPDWLRAGLGGARRALVALWTVGLLLVFLALIVRFDRVAALYDQVSPGPVGGLVLTLLQALYLPNLAVWGLGWAAGPGFSVGAGSWISLTWSEPGLLPLVPVLGILPDQGPTPWPVRIAVLLPVVAGVLLARHVGRHMRPDPLDRALACAVGCVAGAFGGAVLGLLAGGALGGARLAQVGVSPLLVAAMLGGELALGCLLGLGLQLHSVPRRHETPAAAPAESEHAGV